MPIFHNVQQGSSAWLEVRSGIPSASRFSDILTKSGKPSQSAERYLYTLLSERIMGHPVIEHVSLWMQRGSQLETDAIKFFELQTDLDAMPVGFVTNDAGTWGASPDRLVGSDAILEVKCPSEYLHAMALLQNGSPLDAHRVQVQGQLMVTERQTAWVLSFNPEMPPALMKVERDEEFIAKLHAAVSAFSDILEDQWALCVERGWVQTPPVREKSPSEHMRDALLEAQRQ